MWKIIILGVGKQNTEKLHRVLKSPGQQDQNFLWKHISRVWVEGAADFKHTRQMYHYIIDSLLYSQRVNKVLI